MKKRELLLIALCVFTLSLNTTGCKVERLVPVEDPGGDGGGGGGGGGGGTPPTTNTPPDESQKIASLKLYFATTAGVNVGEIVYDSNSDLFSRTSAPTDTISFFNLARSYYFFNLNNSGGVE